MAKVTGEQIFVSAPTGSAPDSITIGGGSIWVEYGNGADSTGASGDSTIVQYSKDGTVENTYTVAGLADGLKYDPVTGNVWALLNNDGNAKLRFINPETQQVSGPLANSEEWWSSSPREGTNARPCGLESPVTSGVMTPVFGSICTSSFLLGMSA